MANITSLRLVTRMTCILKSACWYCNHIVSHPSRPHIVTADVTQTDEDLTWKINRRFIQPRSEQTVWYRMLLLKPYLIQTSTACEEAMLLLVLKGSQLRFVNYQIVLNVAVLRVNLVLSFQTRRPLVGVVRV